jgi:hypothetical protein
VPDIIDGSNEIREDEDWKTIKEITKVTSNFDWSKFVAGFKPSWDGGNPNSAEIRGWSALLFAAASAQSTFEFKITIQQNSADDLRAIVQYGDSDRNTFYRKIAGRGYIDPLADPDWLIRYSYSSYLAEQYRLEEIDNSQYTYYTRWLKIDSKHKDDKYIGYISSSKNDKIILTPKVYPEDEAKIVYVNFFSVEDIWSYKGIGFVNEMESSMMDYEFKTLLNIFENDKLIDFMPESGIIMKIHSPVELRTYDLLDRITGLVNNEQKEEIPNSMYIEEGETVLLFNQNENYRYEIKGTGAGLYGLDIISLIDGKLTTFKAIDVPTTTGMVHEFTVDWDTLSAGEKGVTLKIDNEGDGIFDKTIQLGSVLTEITPPTTTATLSGTLGNNGWYTSNVQVNLTATDNAGGSGVNKTEYSFDNATWITYDAEFTLSNEGTTTVFYKSTDNAGNVEPIKTQEIKISSIPPAPAPELSTIALMGIGLSGIFIMSRRFK